MTETYRAVTAGNKYRKWRQVWTFEFRRYFSEKTPTDYIDRNRPSSRLSWWQCSRMKSEKLGAQQGFAACHMLQKRSEVKCLRTRKNSGLETSLTDLEAFASLKTKGCTKQCFK